jgi:Amt family ammonium transporter
LISTGLFSKPELIAAAFSETNHSGWFYEWGEGSGDFTLIGCQLLATLFIFGWSFTLMGCWFGFLNYMGWFRIDPLEEKVGMDVSRHKGPAYDYTAPDAEDVKGLQDSRHSRKSLNDYSNRGEKKEEAPDSTTKDDAAPVAAEGA